MYKDWEKRNPEKRRELHEKYYSKRRWYLLKSKYGITKKQYEDLLEKQLAGYYLSKFENVGTYEMSKVDELKLIVKSKLSEWSVK